MIGLQRGTVQLLPHDPQWDILAGETIKALWNILGDVACDIRHVGSTSIHTIKAKPILDIAVAVRHTDDILPLIPIMQEHGFYYKNIGHEGEVFFSAGDFERDIRTHHIHVVELNGMEWQNYLNFTAYLNHNPSAARAYEALKENLASQYSHDRNAYTEGKSAFINQILRKAMVYSYLGKTVTIEIDRPIGYVHKKDIVYPINYGYLPGVLGGDGEEMDVYLLGVEQPAAQYTAQIIAIVHREDDVEDKLVAAPIGMEFMQSEIEECIHFQEKYYHSHVEVAYRDVTIRHYRQEGIEDVLPLYAAVGWTNYTKHPEMLDGAFRNSLLTLAAYDHDRPIGIVRVVGDGHSSILIQDLLVHPSYQHRGIGTRLLQEILTRYASVYQIRLLTDRTEKNMSFYRAQGLIPTDEIGVCAMTYLERPQRKTTHMIRPIKLEEIDACVSVIRRSFMTVAEDFGFTQENAPRFTAFSITSGQLRWELAHGFRMYVCVDKTGTLIGFFSLLEKDEHLVELKHLCVLPEHRHRKMGRELLLYAFRVSKTSGYRYMDIGIVEENRQLRTWYEQYGFVHTHTKKFDFFPFTCGYMQKKLFGEDE